MKDNPETVYKYHRKARRDALTALGDKCVKCGFSDPRALQIDHIDGGGLQHVRAVSWKLRYDSLAKGNTDGFQLLCANCNWIKRVENREYTKRFKKLNYSVVLN